MKVVSNDKDSKSFLIESLKRQGILKSEKVEEAILQIKREDFVWQGYRAQSYFDEPLPLGNTGQTISAPHMVVIMLEELELFSGLKVLEIGTGSGYNAALIAFIVSQGSNQSDQPLVVTIERNSELVDFAKGNLAKTSLRKFVEVVEGDGSLGFPQGSREMAYDRIIVTAGAPFIPPCLQKQLKIGGLIIAPVGQDYVQTLVKAKKIETPNGKLELREKKLMHVMFVPLIGLGAHPDRKI